MFFKAYKLKRENKSPPYHSQFFFLNIVVKNFLIFLILLKNSPYTGGRFLFFFKIKTGSKPLYYYTTLIRTGHFNKAGQFNKNKLNNSNSKTGHNYLTLSIII